MLKSYPDTLNHTDRVGYSNACLHNLIFHYSVTNRSTVISAVTDTFQTRLYSKLVYKLFNIFWFNSQLIESNAILQPLGQF